MRPSAVTLFSGGGGTALGLQAAGYDVVGGVEYDESICGVYADNFTSPILCGKVEEVDPRPFLGIDALSASPVCTRASVANANRGESEVDMRAAEGVCRWLRVLRPAVFMLENVRQYRAFASCALIERCLNDLGYFFTVDNLNAADLGGFDPCAYHANFAAKNLAVAIAPDIAAVFAMMRPEDQATHLAKIAVARLDRATVWAIADGAAPAGTNQKQSDGVKQTICGLAGASLTNEDMSRYASMGSTVENFASWLNRCLEDLLPEVKSFTIATATRRITTLKILACILATPSTQNSTIKSVRSLPDGGLEIVGDCPLCRYHYAVPQTRRRMILRAVRDGLEPPLPAPVPWVGWYAAIEDLIPGLPESRFADWQLKRLPDFVGSFLHPHTTADGTTPPRAAEAPAFSIQATIHKATPKAFLCGVQGEGGDLRRDGGTPSPTVTAAHDAAKYRAFLVDGQNGRGPYKGSVSAPRGDNPSQTVTGTAYKGMSRALLIEGDAAGDRPPTCGTSAEPCFTVKTASGGRVHRAWLEQGRVVSMTPRALARFQSVPDTYCLPDSRKLASTVIGNMVPPLMAQRVMEGLRECV